MKFSVLLFLFVASLWANNLVVCAIPALESITKELVSGTDITVMNPVRGEYGIAELPEVISAKASLLDSLSPSVSAVISLRSIMDEDQLYLKLRQNNIRIVEIDAASPLNPSLTAIGTIKMEGCVNPYIWLAPSAVARSAEFIGKDLGALFPSHKEKIDSNLQSIREQIRTLVNDYESKFATVEQFSAATMDRSFDYLVKDVGLFVTLELPGEISWGESEFKEFRAGIADKSFAVILHRWVPFGDMATDAEKAKVPFAIIETGFPGGTLFDGGIANFLKGNYDSILNVFTAK